MVALAIIYCHTPSNVPTQIRGKNFCIQFMSRETHTNQFSLEVIPLYRTTAGEVLAIMSLDCPEGEPLSFYRTFVNHVWNVFQYVCRDLGELRYLVRSMTPSSVPYIL